MEEEEIKKWCKTSKDLIKQLKTNQLECIFVTILILFSSIYFSFSSDLFLVFYSKFCLILSIVMLAIVFSYQYHIDTLTRWLNKVLNKSKGG